MLQSELQLEIYACEKQVNVVVVRQLVKTNYQIKMTTGRKYQEYGVLFKAHQVVGQDM